MSSRPKIEKKKLIKTFFFRAFICYVIWQILYIGFLQPNGKVDDFLTDLSIIGTTNGLNLIGINSYNIENIIYINDSPAVRIENVCNGLELIALYVGFLISFPGRTKFKVIYSFVGGIILLAVNIFREMLLAANYIYFGSTFNFNHKYTYTIIVYLIVFLLWKHWVIRRSIIAKNEEKAD